MRRRCPWAKGEGKRAETKLAAERPVQTFHRQPVSAARRSGDSTEFWAAFCFCPARIPARDHPRCKQAFGLPPGDHLAILISPRLNHSVSPWSSRFGCILELFHAPAARETSRAGLAVQAASHSSRLVGYNLSFARRQ